MRIGARGLRALPARGRRTPYSPKKKKKRRGRERGRGGERESGPAIANLDRIFQPCTKIACVKAVVLV